MVRKKRLCYVIMPFSSLGGVSESQWTEIYNQLFKPAVEESRLGYICERSSLRSGAFTKDIVNNLKHADVVLADITFFNANVMWELGVRHTLSKKTIMIARHDMMKEKIISDMKIYTVHPYDPTNITKINDFKMIIKKELAGFEKDLDRNTSPVFDFLTDEEIIRSSTEQNKILNNLAGLIGELSFNLEFIERVKTNKLNIGPDSITLMKMLSNAIDYFLTTNYVTSDEDFLKKMRLIQRDVHIVNKRLELSILDKRFQRISKETEKILNKCNNVEPLLKYGLKYATKVYNSIKQGDFVTSTSPIILLNEKHKELT